MKEHSRFTRENLLLILIAITFGLTGFYIWFGYLNSDALEDDIHPVAGSITLTLLTIAGIWMMG